MQLRWTEAAAADLEQIADYLFERIPQHASSVVGRLYEAPQQLLKFPLMGRPGKMEGTRELVLSPLPYLVVYTVTGEVVHVARILHGAQRWP